MGALDRARFAHWTDLNEMIHIGVASDAMWRELEILEGVEGLIPHMPEMGALVQVRFCGMLREAKVISIHADGISFTACIDGYHYAVFTVSDLIPAERGGLSPE